MTEVTKPTKPVAPETVRLFEIIGFGQTNEEEYKNKVKNIMEVTGCEQEMAILTLHDCNDETEAIQRLLDSNTAPAQEGWFTKKKTNKKKMISNSVVVVAAESELLDAPKAYVTDGHSGESVEGRKNVRSREREGGNGGWRERRGSQKGSGESWDDNETADTSKNDFRHDRSKPLRNGFSNNSPTYNERRDQDGEERQSSRIFLSKRNHPDDHDRYPKDRSNRDGMNNDRRNPRPYRERKPFRNGDDRDRVERNQWSKPKYRDEVGEHELDDRQRDRKFGKKGFNKRSDKERIVFDSSNGSSKTTPDLNGDIYIKSADTIDWDNPVLSNTDWGEEEVKKQLEDYADEDKCIEALLSEGCVFHNSNYDQDNDDVEQTNIVSSSISSLPQPNHDTSNSHPMFSPQTTSLPTPSVSIPTSIPPSHNQATGVVFFQTGRMNLRRRIRSKIPQVPVELPNTDLDSFDIQFGSITLPVTQVDSQEDFKPTESPSPVEEEKTFSNANFQESDLSTSNEQLPSSSAHKNTEHSPLPSSPPPKNDQPIPSRSPVPQDKKPPISGTPTPQQAPIPTPVTVQSHSQTHSQYHQHMNRQNERKAYSENTGKMHHQGGMSGNSVKLQQHPQIVPPVNSIDQPPGVPYLMAPMASVGGPNALPPTTMSNLPRGPGKNFQTPVLYNPPGQYGMMTNYYWEPEMMRMMAQNNNPASNMVKEQNSNQVFQNSDAKFHEPTSPANPQTGMPGQSMYVPFHGYGFIPGMFPMIPKGNSYPNPVPAGGQTPYQNQPLHPNIPTHPDQHSDYKPNFANIQQKPGAMPQAADMQNMYKGYDQKSGIPFGFGYPFAQYMNPQMMPQQQPQYSNLNPNMLMQQPLDGQRPKW